MSLCTKKVDLGSPFRLFRFLYGTTRFDAPPLPATDLLYLRNGYEAAILKQSPPFSELRRVIL